MADLHPPHLRAVLVRPELSTYAAAGRRWAWPRLFSSSCGHRMGVYAVVNGQVLCLIVRRCASSSAEPPRRMAWWSPLVALPQAVSILTALLLLAHAVDRG